MLDSPPDTLAVSRRFLKIVVGLNQLLGVLILGLLITSFFLADVLFPALGVRLDGDSSGLVLGMRLIMLIGVVSVPLAHRILTQLLAIVETVGAGDPFVAENAMRLQAIAWSLLGLEVLHFAVGAISLAISSDAQPIDLDWSFSLTRWIAVLLLFVLARVFDQGTRMRADLEGTV